MSSSFNPTRVNEREILMDALRGLALLGIFIANIPGFNFLSGGKPEGPFFTSWDKQVDFLNVMLIEGKFYSIFSLLFGWGIAVQMQRRESKSLNPVTFARRRLTFMLLLGLAHIIFLWIGDIVAFYAMLGFVLLGMRKWKDRTLVIISILLVLSPILLYYIKMQFPWARAPQEFMRTTGIALDKKFTGVNSEEEFFAFARNLNYFDLVKINISGFFFRYGDLFFQSRISKVLALFLIGFVMGRNGRYKKLIKDQQLLWKIAIVGLVVGLVANYFMAVIMDKYPRAYYSHEIHGWYRTILYSIGVAPLAIGYVALFFLFALSGIGKFFVRLLHPLGKMAFTNYLAQSFIATIFFMPFGFNMVGKLGPFYGFLLAFVVFLVQIIISNVWLRYFQYGPVEWFWRSASYGKWQKIKKRSATNEEKEKPEFTAA